jgi:hypothetical protein
MKKPAHALHEIVLGIKGKLKQRTDAAALHDMTNELTCGLREYVSNTSPPTRGEAAASRAAALNELMLEQVAEICCHLMFNEQAALDGLKAFVDTHMQRLLNEQRIDGDAARTS